MLCDLDGVVWLARQPIPGSPEAVARLRAAGWRVITREGGTINSSGLVGEFVLPPIPPGTPELTVDKTGPATMNPAEYSDFGSTCGTRALSTRST